MVSFGRWLRLQKLVLVWHSSDRMLAASEDASREYIRDQMLHVYGPTCSHALSSMERVLLLLLLRSRDK